MRYLCTNCNFIYDEWQWEENVAHGTRFEELSDNFECPVCGENQDSFHEIREEINYISDNPYDHLEVDHFIETQYKWDKLIVTIWNEIHPMWESHRITSVSLYDEYWDLIEEKFMDYDEDPIIEFDFDDLWEYEVRCRCSLHGVWWKKFSQ